MRNKLLAGFAAGALLTLGSLATASAAVASPMPAAKAAASQTPVTPDQCYAGGGGFGGYNADDQPFCEDGTYNGVPLTSDPDQGWCPAGQHIVLVYLVGLECAPDMPNT